MTARFALDASGWLVEPAGVSSAHVRLICFPHAGGSASTFYEWSRLFAPEVRLSFVELPGRGWRRQEEMIAPMNELIRAAVDALASRIRAPFALYGHSMGALLALEFARELRRRKLPAPLFLVASGHRAPHLPDRQPRIAHLSDRELFEALQRRYDAIPAEVAAHADLIRSTAPTIRADLTMLEQYHFAPEPPLECAVSAFGGDRDESVTRHDLEGWKRHTAADFDLRMFPGDHFFIKQARLSVVTRLHQSLSKHYGQAGSLGTGPFAET